MTSVDIRVVPISGTLCITCCNRVAKTVRPFPMYTLTPHLGQREDRVLHHPYITLVLRPFGILVHTTRTCSQDRGGALKTPPGN